MDSWGNQALDVGRRVEDNNVHGVAVGDLSGKEVAKVRGFSTRKYLRLADHCVVLPKPPPRLYLQIYLMYV